jgi:hypothetical protein
LKDSHLAAVESRRRFPTRATQAFQVTAQNTIISGVLGATGSLPVPFPVRLMQRWPWLRRIPARIIGMGFRPEHVQTAEWKRQS